MATASTAADPSADVETATANPYASLDFKPTTAEEVAGLLKYRFGRKEELFSRVEPVLTHPRTTDRLLQGIGQVLGCFKADQFMATVVKLKEYAEFRCAPFYAVACLQKTWVSLWGEETCRKGGAENWEKCGRMVCGVVCVGRSVQLATGYGAKAGL